MPNTRCNILVTFILHKLMKIVGKSIGNFYEYRALSNYTAVCVEFGFKSVYCKYEQTTICQNRGISQKTYLIA